MPLGWLIGWGLLRNLIYKITYIRYKIENFFKNAE